MDGTTGCGSASGTQLALYELFCAVKCCLTVAVTMTEKSVREVIPAKLERVVC